MPVPRSFPILRLAIPLLVAIVPPALRAQTTLDSDEPRPGEYRVTVFPFHRITDTLTGFGYLGYVTNPDEEYTTEYLGYGMSYTPTHHVQWWGGLVSTATQNENSADKLELRPFVGIKLFLQNKWRWNVYNYTRWEYRIVENKDTDDWSDWSRYRSRFGLEIPLTGVERAWKPK